MKQLATINELPRRKQRGIQGSHPRGGELNPKLSRRFAFGIIRPASSSSLRFCSLGLIKFPTPVERGIAPAKAEPVAPVQPQIKKSSPKKKQVQSWLIKMQGASASLAKIPQETEKDFLGLGQGLHDFYAETKKLADLSAFVSREISGEKLVSQITALQFVCDRTKAMNEIYAEGMREMESILARLDDIQRHLGTFEKITRNLHIVCNLIRIESARFSKSDGGFDTLVLDVKKLTSDIETRSGNLLNESDLLIRLIRENVSRIKSLHNKNISHSGYIFSHAAQNITALKNKHELSTRMMEEATSQWKNISGRIGEIVASLQFHDITRQRVEHVVHTLEETAGKFQQTKTDEKSFILRFIPFLHNHSGDETEKYTPIYQICKIQQAQLDNTENDIIAAGEKIITSLLKIAESIASLQKETLGMTSSSESCGSDFLQELRTEFNEINEVVSAYEAADAGIFSMLDRLGEPIKQMNGLIREIEIIGIEMKKVAINASIHAAHAGVLGVGLSVLAESISQPSVECGFLMDKISAEIRTIGSVKDTLTKKADMLNGKDEKTAKMSDYIEAAVKEICSMNDEIAGTLTKISADSRALCHQLETTAQHIDTHNQMSHGLHNAAQELGSIMEEMGIDYEKAAKLSEEQQDTQELNTKYTMELERDVHRLALNIAPVKSAAAGEAAPTGSEDLGDNVELF